MAKNEQQRNYMQVFVPKGNGKRYTSEQALMYGLDKRGIADSLTMEKCENIDVKALPYIETTGTPLRADGDKVVDSTKKVLGVYAYNSSLYIIRGGATIQLLRITEKLKESTTDEDEYITVVDASEVATVQWENTADEDVANPSRREMAVFCYYPVSVGTMAYETEPEYYLMIYPDRKYVKVDFESGEDDEGGVKIIAPVMEYDDSTEKEHKLTFNDADPLTLGMTIYKDGTVAVTSSTEADEDFEGCKLRATFTDVNNNACVGEVAFKGTYLPNPGYGVFLKSVDGTTAVLRLRGKRPTSGERETFYVKDTSDDKTVFSKEIDFSKVYGEISEEFTVTGLVAGKEYYAYFDYNDNYTRYDLTFTLADKTEVNGGDLKVEGKLFDASGNAIVLDISKEYAVSYNVTDGVDKSYMAKKNGSFTIKLGSKENSEGNSLSPKFQHITVWNSRLFGTRDNVVVCSSAGTPFDWTLDSPESELDNFGITIGGYDETHSWYSTTQANTKASGDVTAITSFDGHPVIFKDDFMHEVYNTKNPFRIQDICATGCVSAKSICELDSVLYFASRDGIYRYAGGYPKRISDALGDFICDDDTCCGAYDGVLYVYNPEYSDELIYTYDPSSGLWAAIGVPFDNDAEGGNKIVGFAAGSNYLYAVGANSEIGYFPKVGSSTSDSWSFETNINLFDSSGDKRVHSLMIVSEGDAPGVRINGKEVAVTSNNPDSEVVKTRVLLRGFDGESFKLRLSGKDYCKIHRIDIVYSYSGKRFK